MRGLVVGIAIAVVALVAACSSGTERATVVGRALVVTSVSDQFVTHFSATALNLELCDLDTERMGGGTIFCAGELTLRDGAAVWTVLVSFRCLTEVSISDEWPSEIESCL